MSPSKPKALLRSLLISYLLSGILLLVMSFALYKLKLKEAQINTAVYAVYVIACLVGGILSGKALQNRRFFWGLLTGLLYFRSGSGSGGKAVSRVRIGGSDDGPAAGGKLWI